MPSQGVQEDSFHNNTEMLFAFFTVLTFALMTFYLCWNLQKQW